MSEVDVSRTFSAAQLAARHAAALGLQGFEGLSGATVSGTPLKIFDVNGELLFHDHHLVRGGEVVGTIRAAANRKLGAHIVAAYHSAPGWSPASGLRMARETLGRSRAAARIAEIRLVCYAYPKIGVQLRYAFENTERTEIFDAASGDLVAEDGGEDHQFTRYSLIGRLGADVQMANVERFDEADGRLLEFLKSEETSALPDSGLSTPEASIYLPEWAIGGVRQGLVLQSPWCPNSPMGNSHYAQITNYFCVDASAQMLLEHYGFNYTQNQIAVAMGTTAAQGGTSGAGLTSGFATLTNNDLVLTFDFGQTRAQQFQDAVTEVSANRPLFTQVPHHYRVCMGFCENTGLLALLLGLNQSLYIFDPWPWNPNLCAPGSPYWESWATSPVMWFGIVHHA